MDAAAAEEIARLKDVVVEARERISDLGGSTSKVSDKLGATAGALGTFTGAMNSGAQGMSAYNGLVSTVSGNLSSLAKNADGSATSLSVLANASGSLITAIFKQSDALFKSYQDISQIGAAGSAGMQGVFDNMQKFGYSIEELPKFGALLAQNSENLAKFGGTVEQGTKQFANVAEGIQRSGLQTEFERMGMSVDSINKGTAAYLKTQAMTGASAAKSQAELTAGAAEYIRQQDILTKLTGKSAETLLKNEEARMADNRYNSVQSELQMKADAARDAGQEATAKDFERQIKQNAALVERAPEGMKQGIQDLLTGNAQTKEAQSASILNNRGAQMIQSGKFEAADVLEAISQESKANKAITYARGKVGAMDQFGSRAVQAQTEAAAMGREGVLKPKEATAAAEASQKAQREKPETAVANQVAIRQSQQEITRAMNSLVQTGVHAATAAMQHLTTGIEAGVTRMPGTGDKTGTRNTPGRGDREDTGFQGKIITPEIIKQNQGTIDKFMNPGATLRDIAKDIIGPLSGANTVVPAAAKISAATQSAEETARLSAKATPAPVQAATPATSAPVPVQAATPAKTQFSLSSVMANIIEKNKLGNNQYTGPNSTMPAPVGDTTPTGPVTAPASSATATDSGMLITSMNELLQSNRSQQASLEELIDLSRKSLSQNGKLLQVARQ